MQIIRTLEDLKNLREGLTDVGFVPTMGNLHEGHLSLVRSSFRKHQNCIVSIFVNPLQFGPDEDFDAYPRTLDEDIQKLSLLLKGFPNSKIIVFAPINSEVIFPSSYSTSIRNTKFENILCGKSRPGHFEGVLTVVHRLFKIVKPDSSFFGLKDYQQYHLIRSMCTDHEMGVHIYGCPIIRNNSGLALSSRNSYLSNEDKKRALILPSALKKVLKATEGKFWNECRDIVISKIQEILNDKCTDWDYLEIREKETLEKPQEQTKDFVILGAIYINGTRLIDNMYTE